MMMKKLLFLFLLLCLPLCAGAEETFTMTAPDAARPYAGAVIALDSPEAGELALTLEDEYIRFEIARRQIPAGHTEIAWDGLIACGEAPQRGMYTLRAELSGTKHIYSCQTALRIMAPTAALQYCIPSGITAPQQTHLSSLIRPPSAGRSSPSLPAISCAVLQAHSC